MSGMMNVTELASNVAISNFLMVTFYITLGFTISAGTLVGNALGINDKARVAIVIKAALLVELCGVVLLITLTALLKYYIAMVFTANLELQVAVERNLQWILVLLFFDGF